MMDEKKILEAIETAIGKDSMEIVIAECRKHTDAVNACKKCKFGKLRANKTYGCTFQICPMDWEGEDVQN